MQGSHTAHHFRRDDDQVANYKPIKYIQSDQNSDQREYVIKQEQPHRSMSSSFRQSIRRLTSCASARRKPGKTTNHTKQGPPILESSIIGNNEQRYSSKPSSLPKKPSLPLQKQSYHSVESTNDDIPPAVPPRQPLDKKNSVQMQSAILNPSVLSQSSAQISSNATDDTLSQSSLAPTRILPSKEISTSLVNLMGDASRSVNGNNSTQSTTTTQEARRISTGHSNTIDRLGLLDTLSNASTTGMVESPSIERTVFNGNHSTNSYQKATNEYTWCYESSIPSQTSNGTSFDECLPQLEIDDKPLIYRQQFEKTEHLNWYGTSESNGPVIISYKHVIDQTKQRSVLAIVRIRQGTLIETISDVHSSSMPIEILRRICQQCGITDIEYFDPVFCDGTHDLLLKYDESHVSNQHKFGIIYQRENQLTEEDIFSNEKHSLAMEKFLDLIGTRVKLKDFRGFRGGLDVKSDQTGTESVYEQFQNHEIMFHVSTLLPYSKSERQQLERKRHIGNDIVAIIFQENETTTFSPECIASQFLHVYLIITPLNSDGTEFKVSTIYRDNVPLFGPNSSHSNIFHCDQLFKQWILTKLINAEMAACRAHTIQKFHERTRMSLFENLYRTLHENNRPLMNLIFYHSQYKHECDIEQQQQREEMQKTSDRDSSLLGSVRRRLIAPKLRVQNTTNENGKSSPTTIVITTPPSNESRSKTRSMTMDLRRSVSRESITTNGNHSGKMTSFFSSSKTNTSRIDKSTASRSLLDQENIDSYSSPHSTNKFLSPATCPSSPWTAVPPNGFPSSSSSNDFNQNDNSYSHSTSMLNTSLQFNNKSLSDETDIDNQIQLIPDDLQSSTKEDLIKFVLALQQQHNSKLVHIDKIHSNALKRLELQLIEQQTTIDRDSP